MLNMKKKKIIRLLIVAICILLIPFVGNILSSEWNWSISDFLFAFLLIFAFGLVYEFLAGLTTRKKYKLILFFGVVTLFLLVWIELAVGGVSQGIKYLIN